MKVLITGIASPLARLVAVDLVAQGCEVIGLDRRVWEGAPTGVESHAIDIRKRAAEDVFRKCRPDAVIHMATVTHLRASSEERYRINLGGTRAVLEHAVHYGAKQLIFVGRHTVYGASPDAPLYHHEHDPPMAGTTFPELADLVAADLYATTALWRSPGLTTSVLRICYALGPTLQGTLASFLRGPRVPTVLGYDPLFQFMHDADVATSIRLALMSQLRGIYNVSGPSPLPLSVIIRAAGRQVLPLPEPLFQAMLGHFGMPRLPRGAVAHIKYPVVVDGGPFRKATGFSPAYDEHGTISAFREASPPPRPQK